MSEERVKAAIKELESAINEGEHNVDVHIEDLGDTKEISFYLDESADDGEAAGSIIVVPAV